MKKLPMGRIRKGGIRSCLTMVRISGLRSMIGAVPGAVIGGIIGGVGGSFGGSYLGTLSVDKVYGR